MFIQNKRMQWKYLTYVFNKIFNGNFYGCGFCLGAINPLFMPT